MSGAFLALWNSIGNAALQPEYDVWHTFEHVPERVGLPGFIEARRYMSVATGGTPPRYFTCYGLDHIEALNTPRYRDLLTHPTPWSARMRPELRDFFRLPCVLRGSFGPSSARKLATLHLRGDAETLAPPLNAALATLQARAGVVSAQWGALQAPADFQMPVPQEATHGTATQPGSDVVVMLHGLDQATLAKACTWLLQTLQPLASPVSDPAFFEFLSQVRQADLAYPLDHRQPALSSLFAAFNDPAKYIQGDTA